MATKPSIPLHTRILLALVLGAGAGGIANAVLGPASPRLIWTATNLTEPVGQLFLRLLLLLVVPLVFSSLVVGVAGMGDIRRLGRVGARTLGYTLVMSTISVVIGLTLANTMRPGERIRPEISQQLQERFAMDAEKQVAAAPGAGEGALLSKVVKTAVPTNVFTAIAKDPPDMLGLMFFALFFGVGLTLVAEAKSRPVLTVLEGVYEAVAKCIELVMRMAPFAIFCLLFTMTSRFGFGLLASLGWYVAAVLLGLSLHMFGVYSISVALLSRLNPIDFFRRIKTIMITAFSTSSSNATLPTALRVTEENLGVPRDINSFVLTIGATANQNGTALFEGVTILFLAQLAGVDLSMGQLLMVLYLAILGGIGTAGVPSGSIPFIILVLATIHVNPAMIAIVLGVDRILDMCRTVVNVVGDVTAATYVARSEGATLEERKVAPAIDL